MPTPSAKRGRESQTDNSKAPAAIKEEDAAVPAAMAAKRFKISSNQYQKAPESMSTIDLVIFRGRLPVRHVFTTFYFDKKKLVEAAPLFFNPANLVNTKHFTLESSPARAGVFGIFLTWIDTKDFDMSEQIIELKTVEHERKESVRARWVQFVELSFLAEVLQAAEFQSAVLDELVRLAKTYNEEFDRCILPSLDSFLVIHEKSVAGSPLRRFLVDLLMWKDLSPRILPRDFTQILSDEFKTEIVEAGMRAIRSSANAAPWTKDAVVYHGTIE